MNEKTLSLYQHVLRGLSEECSQIESLDERFVSFVSDVRDIERDAIAGAPPADWERDWTRIGTLLADIHVHAANARKRLQDTVSPDSDPLAEWAPVAAIDDEIEALLAKRKAAAAALVTPAKHADWEAGWMALESHFFTLRAHARSLQVKLELQRRFGKQKATEIAADLAAKLPEDLRDAKGVEALHKADEQLQEDRQHFHGVWDMLKALALWVETPEERARQIREEK